jgi:hypothetical protein
MIEHYTPGELEREFLMASDGTTPGKINGTHSVAVASPIR